MIDFSGYDLSLFHSLCAELGPDVVFERYFDEDMNVRDDAPEKLKEEIRVLRMPDGHPPIPEGVVVR